MQIWASTTRAPFPYTRWRNSHGRAHAVGPLPQNEETEGPLSWANQESALLQGFKLQEQKRFTTSQEAFVKGEQSHPQLGLWLAGGLEIDCNHQIHCRVH